MFRIRSLRMQGAMVEVFENGKLINKHISGMGVTTSERLTEDMKVQKQLKFIRVDDITHEIKAPKEEAASPEPPSEESVVDTPSLGAEPNKPDLQLAETLAAQDQFEATKMGEANPPPSDSSRVLYSKLDYSDMKKKELIEFAADHKLSTQATTKKGLIEELLKHEIPKE